MYFKDGTEAKVGDVIRWNCWDYDDFTSWTFTGLYTQKGIVYLGGGMDFGHDIGKLLSVEEVIGESQDNDPDDVGIERVGQVSNLALYISKFREEEDLWKLLTQYCVNHLE